ncbi:YktB family protein [Gottfriedia luciferensis]|uniref:YktB family protein n=1 Tax=Gottfriedia luciferensis TaxID=178774 RepID=UPI000B4305ED|nr:DUF1054 domain-containing protein [Gottfriedia luciferensis]
MVQPYFKESDFEIFTTDSTLETRMAAIQNEIQPKFKEIEQEILPFLSEQANQIFFGHIAKHARRTVNAPKDTWIAFATNNRGYKMLPHFQFGLWGSHLFVLFGIIYESPNKQSIAINFEKNKSKLFKMIPNDFVLSYDHMKPDVIQKSKMKKEDFYKGIQRLHDVKKSEFLCGITIQKDEAITLTKEELIHRIKETYNTLIPLYKISIK